MMELARKILVVDDTPQNIKVLDAILSPRGYRVVTARSGAEALQKVRDELPTWFSSTSSCRACRGMKWPNVCAPILPPASYPSSWSPPWGHRRRKSRPSRRGPMTS